MLKKTGLLLAVVLLVAACGSKPIYNPENRMIPLSAQQFPLERIETLIIQAGQTRNWKFTREGAGHLSAAQDQQKYAAVVDIHFDQKSYRITYRSSRGLEAKNGMIHAHYNFWIRNLESDIDSRLANAALTGAGQS